MPWIRLIKWCVQSRQVGWNYDVNISINSFPRHKDRKRELMRPQELDNHELSKSMLPLVDIMRYYKKALQANQSWKRRLRHPLSAAIIVAGSEAWVRREDDLEWQPAGLRGVSVPLSALSRRTAAMVQTCSAYGCKNRYDKDRDISFHKYVHFNYARAG